MRKIICPVCDSELNDGNYCSLCRRVVRHPKIEERNYYLNERRPGGQAKERAAMSAYYDGGRKTQPVYRPEQRKAGSIAEVRKIPLAVKIILALFLLGIVANIFFMQFTSKEVIIGKSEILYDGEGPLWEFPESGEEYPGYEAYELRPEQVKSDGVSCNFYSHADMDAESAGLLVETFLNEYGSGEFYTEQSSYNQKYIYDDGSENMIYDTCLTYFYGKETDRNMENEKPFYYVSVGYDTGSGLLHYFQLRSAHIEFASEAVSLFSESLDRLDTSESVRPEEVRDKILSLEDDDPGNYEDAFWIQGDNWSVYGYKESDGSYFFSVDSNERNDNSVPDTQEE